MDVRLVPGGRFLADLLPMLQPVDAPPDDPPAIGPAPHHPAVSRLELEATERRYYLRLSGYIAVGGFVICH